MRCDIAVRAGLLVTLFVMLVSPAVFAEDAEQAVRVNVMLAENYLRTGDLAAALEKANNAVKRDAKSAQAHAMLAMVYDRMEQQSKAKKSYLRAISLTSDSGHGAIFNAYAVWHCRHGRYDEAEAQFTKSLADPLYKLHGQVLKNAGRCAFMARNIAVAEKHYRTVLELDPDDEVALESLAVIFLDKGDALRARAFIQRREYSAPATAETLELAARIEDAAGSSDAAADYRKRLNEQFPPSTQPAPEGSRKP